MNNLLHYILKWWMRSKNRRLVAAISDYITLVVTFLTTYHLTSQELYIETLKKTSVFTSLFIFIFSYFFSKFFVTRVNKAQRVGDFKDFQTLILITIFTALISNFIFIILHNLSPTLVSESFNILFWVLFTSLFLTTLNIPRILYRMLRERIYDNNFKDTKNAIVVAKSSELYGTDTIFKLNHQKNYTFVGCIYTDDQSSAFKNLQKYNVLGYIKDFDKIFTDFSYYNQPKYLLITSAALDSVGINKISQITKDYNLVIEIFNINKKYSKIRPIQSSDLIGRYEKNFDPYIAYNDLCNKTILVTGGGGSIGMQLCINLALLKPKKIIIIDNCELNIFNTARCLNRIHPNLQLIKLLIDIKDQKRIENVFLKYKPHHIFHAAAYKHVSLVEDNKIDGAKTNIVGTHIVSQAAIKSGASSFTLLSTDKAVNPITFMGMTKRFNELYCFELSVSSNKPEAKNGFHQTASKCKFITVRFGNVLGTTGSVLKIFKEQLKNNKPLTVSHPEVARYFMSPEEASSLVLGATSLGIKQQTNNLIYILDMGSQIFIKDLATRLIKLYPNYTSHITYSGLGKNEKLSESLIYEQEVLKETQVKGIYTASQKHLPLMKLDQQIPEIAKLIEEQNEDKLETLVKEIVTKAKIKSLNYDN